MKKGAVVVIAVFLAVVLACCSAPKAPQSQTPLSAKTNAAEESAPLDDLRPMVRVNGRLYLDTGRESEITARCGVTDGEILFAVAPNEEPEQDNTSNFGTGYGYQYGPDGTLEVRIDGKWIVFVQQESQGV